MNDSELLGILPIIHYEDEDYVSENTKDNNQHTDGNGKILWMWKKSLYYQNNQLLIISIGQIPSTYISTYFPNSQLQLIATMIVSNVQLYGINNINNKIPTVWTSNSNYLYTLTSEKFKENVSILICNQNILPADYNNFVSTFFNYIKPSKTIILDTFNRINCTSTLSLDENKLHIIETKKASIDRLNINSNIDYLKYTMCDTLGAAFLMRCELLNIWARLGLSIEVEGNDIDLFLNTLNVFKNMSYLLPSQLPNDTRDLKQNMIIQLWLKSKYGKNLPHI